MTLFIATFSTLLAIINPLEALPVFLQLAARKDDHERVLLARRACMYAVALMFFFLLFGTLILRLFGIPLSMVRIVGGIILTRLGFMLFSSRPTDANRARPQLEVGATCLLCWAGESRLPHSGANRRWMVRNRFRRGGFFDS